MRALGWVSLNQFVSPCSALTGFRGSEYAEWPVLNTQVALAPEEGDAVRGDTEEWDRHIKIDLSGVYYTCAEVGKVMIEQNYGKIINIGSIHSRVIFPGGGISAYSSAKGGVMNLTKNLAVEWAKYNITVNAIGPAVFATELTTESIEMEGFMDLIAAYCPMGRLGEPGELDGLAIYLASDASSFCTGQLICVDGGWTAI